LDLADGHPAGVQRQHFVVESREPALVFANQSRFKCPLAIARDVDRDRTIVGLHGLATRAVAVIGRVVRLHAAGRIAQMVSELATQRPLDQRFLETADGGVELLGREWPLPNGLVENLGRDRRQRCVAHQGLTTRSGHNGSSCYAPHTKFLTPSGRTQRSPRTQDRCSSFSASLRSPRLLRTSYFYFFGVFVPFVFSTVPDV